MARGKFHFGNAEFSDREVNQILLEECNEEGNFHLQTSVIGFLLPTGSLMINGKPMSGAMAASFRRHFNAEQVFVKGTWVFFPEKEEQKEADGNG